MATCNREEGTAVSFMDFAKEKLSTTDLSVSEIAYELGFKHSQSFNKVFKTKTSRTPLEFRQSFAIAYGRSKTMEP